MYEQRQNTGKTNIGKKKKKKKKKGRSSQVRQVLELPDVFRDTISGQLVIREAEVAEVRQLAHLAPRDDALDRPPHRRPLDPRRVARWHVVAACILLSGRKGVELGIQLAGGGREGGREGGRG